MEQMFLNFSIVGLICQKYFNTAGSFIYIMLYLLLTKRITLYEYYVAVNINHGL